MTVQEAIALGAISGASDRALRLALAEINARPLTPSRGILRAAVVREVEMRRQVIMLQGAA